MTQTFSSKQASEAFAICFDFTDVLDTETIVSAVITAIDQVSLADVTATILDGTKQSNTTKVVYGWVRAGTTGHRYVITCKIVSSGASNYELDGILPVDDIPEPGVGSGNLVLAPMFEPVTLEELKLHLRIDSDVSEDDLLNNLITTARENIEDITRRAIITQTWKHYLQGWPSANYFKLPYGNLQSVTSIKWKDTAGTESTLVLTTDYLVETNGDQCGKVVLPYSGCWPNGTLYPSNPICITFICGWTTAALVPYRIKSAIKLLAAQMYEGRGEDVVGQTVVSNKIGDKLLASCRLFDEF